MMIYILDSLTLEKVDLIEDYEVCVWTERFIEAGDVQLELGATHQNAVRTRPNTMLLHSESDEPMYIETREIKDGKITAKGKTVEAFFNDRWIGPWEQPAGHPANSIRSVISNMQTRLGGRFAIPNLRVQEYGPDPAVPNMFTHVDAVHGIERAYDTALRMAQQYSLGIAVKRQRNPDTHELELVFVVRETNDRTTKDDYVRFSPGEETFASIDEMYSLQGWVDVIVVHPPRPFTHTGGLAADWPPISYPPKADRGGPYSFGLTPLDNPFDWRIEEITADDIDENYLDDRLKKFYSIKYGTPEHWKDLSGDWKIAILGAEMTSRAQEEWRKRQVTQKVAFDGEVPGEILKYGSDYHLGDLVVVEGNFTGGKQVAMVSEHIRANDTSGRRSYPTLAKPLEPYSGPDINVPSAT